MLALEAGQAPWRRVNLSWALMGFFFFWQIRARILHSNVENNVQNITKTREFDE